MARPGLSEDELALFDLLKKDNPHEVGAGAGEAGEQEPSSIPAQVDRSAGALAEKEQTQAEVETFILDYVYQELPTAPFTDSEKLFHNWRISTSGSKAPPALSHLGLLNRRLTPPNSPLRNYIARGAAFIPCRVMLGFFTPRLPRAA
jgi:hypothetical protein